MATGIPVLNWPSDGVMYMCLLPTERRHQKEVQPFGKIVCGFLKTATSHSRSRWPNTYEDISVWNFSTMDYYSSQRFTLQKSIP